MAVTSIQIWRGTEAARASSTAVPADADIIITDERKLYLGDGVTPLSQLQPQYEQAGAAAAGDAVLASQIAALQQRQQPATRQFTLPVNGWLTLGQLATEHRIEQGATIGVIEAYANPGPTGSAAIINLRSGSITGTILYTLTLPAGASSMSDTNLGDGIIIPDSTLIILECTQVGSGKPGGNLSIILAERQGTTNALTSIGTVGNIVTTAQAGAFTVSWGYTAKDANDDLDHFAVRYNAGSTPPATLAQGTTAADVLASSNSTQVSGLSFNAPYAFAVFPVGADGAVGAPGTGTVVTTGTDSTPPGSGSLAIQSVSQSSVTVQYTPDASATDYAGFTLRRGDGTTTFPATITSAHPAGAGVGATGAGLWIPASQGNTFTDTGLSSSTNYAYSAFPQDTTGNIQKTPATAKAFTKAAPTTGQGNYGLIPASYAQNYFTDFSAGSSLLSTGSTTDFMALGPGYKQQSQGPSEPTNCDIITDPNDSTNKFFRLRNRYITNGFYNSSYWSYKSDWADGGTDGTGWYGARMQLNGHHIQYGALEFRCRVGDANGGMVTSSTYGGALLANNTKGGNIMWYTDASLTGTAWPQDELDLWEIFQAGQAQINNHTNNGGNQQAYNRWNFDVTQWTWVTCLCEPPPAGTNGDGRIRVWYNNVCMFDTNTPYVGSNLGVPTGQTKTNAASLLTPQAKKFVGCSLEYSGYWADKAHTIKAATFTAGTGTGSTQRQAGSLCIDSLQLWTAA